MAHPIVFIKPAQMPNDDLTLLAEDTANGPLIAHAFWQAADAARWREIALALASDTIRVIGGEDGPWRVHDCRGPWTGRRDSHQSRESAMLAWHAWHAQRHTQRHTQQTKEPT